jgi:hypothetical protein
MGRVSSTYGERRGVDRVLMGKPEGRNHLENPCVDGRIILKTDLLEVSWEGMDQIDLAEARHRWPAVVNAVMNIRIS